jgi:hypothetical protein
MTLDTWVRFQSTSSQFNIDAGNLGAMLLCPRLFRDQGAAMALETAFTMDSPAIKFGPGVTSEVGFNMRQLGARRVPMLTHPGLAPSQMIELVLRALRLDTTPVEICWANG